MDGVIYHGNRLVPHVTEFIEWLEKNDKNFLFLTNGSGRSPRELAQKLEDQIDEIKELKRAIEAFKAREAAGEADQFLFGARSVENLRIITAVLPNATADKLRQMGDVLRDKASDIVGVLATVANDKITFLAVCGKDAVTRGVRAGDLVKMVCAICGGSGGGKPDSAMGGGKDVMKLDDALAQVDDFVVSKL